MSIYLYLDLLNKVVMPRVKQLVADIERCKQQQELCLQEQQYIQKRIAREIELYKQRIKENKNA